MYGCLCLFYSDIKIRISISTCAHAAYPCAAVPEQLAARQRPDPAPAVLPAASASRITDIHLRIKSVASPRPLRENGGRARPPCLCTTAAAPSLLTLPARHTHTYILCMHADALYNIRGRFRLFLLLDFSVPPPVSGACMGTSFSALPLASTTFRTARLALPPPRRPLPLFPAHGAACRCGCLAAYSTYAVSWPAVFFSNTS